MPLDTSTLASEPVSKSNKQSVKIAYIGGGSREWAIKLLTDLALSDYLSGSVELYDIDYNACLHNQALGEQVFDLPSARSRFEVKAVNKIDTALKGADFVIISIEPGSTELRRADLEIPAKYGILQSVGDTTGPGGLLRAMRCVPTYRDLSAAIMEHCPKAWVINYTNPMAVCTGALHRAAPDMKAFGCCHEVFHTQSMLADYVSKWFDLEKPPREAIELDIAGVNHFTFATKAMWNGIDLMPRLIEMVNKPGFFRDYTEKAIHSKSAEKWYDSECLIAFDFLYRYGALGAAGDRHLAEFVSGYLQDEATLHRWGVILTPYSWRVERSQSPRPTLQSITRDDLKPSGEEGVAQMEALVGCRELTTNINLPNAGQIDAMPRKCIVESYAEFKENRIRPIVSTPLPTALANHQERLARQQQLTLDAAWEGNIEMAFQALVSDALVNIPTDKAWKMFNEMLAITIVT